MKQKDFIFNIIFLLFINLLIKPFWILGIDRGVQNAVGAENYGIYFVVLNFTILFNMLLDLGLTNFNNRNIAQNTQLLSKHISGILSLKLLLGVIYILLVFIAGVIFGYRDFQIKILIWLAFNQFLNAMILYLRSNISALLMFKTDGVLSVLDRLITIAICSILLWGNVTCKPFQVMWFVYAQTAAYLISATVAFMIVFFKAKTFTITWNFVFYRAILKKSLPFALLTMLMAIYGRIDPVIIHQLLSKDIAAYQAGIFASAFRLLEALVTVALLFAAILLPLFSKMLKNKEDLAPIIKSAFSLLFFFSVTATVLLIAYRVSIFSALYSKNVQLYPDFLVQSVQVFAILILCLIPWSMTYIFGTLLTANGSLRLLNLTSAIAIAVNLAINFTLIPMLEARGAAIASLSTQTSIAIMQFIIAFKLLKIPFSTIPWIRCLLYIGLFTGSTYLATIYLPFNTLINLFLCGGAALVWAFVTGLLPLKLIKNLFAHT